MTEEDYEKRQLERLYETVQSHFDRGYEALCHFRDFGVVNIPTREWFKKRFKTEEEYKTWLHYKFEYEDVSDSKFGEKTPQEQRAFYEREMLRWHIGLWKEVPSFSALPIHEKEAALKINPLAGKVQVLPATHYILLNYIPVEDLDKNDILRAVYYRRDSMLFDIVESLAQYTLVGDHDREWLLHFKTRGSHFSTNMNAYIISRLIREKQFKSMITIDVEEKISSTGKAVETQYRRLPNWVQSWTPAEKGKQPRSLLTRWAGDKQQYGLQLEEWDGEMGEIDKRKRSTILVRIPKPKKFEQERAHVVFGDEANLYEHNISEVIQKALGSLIGSQNKRTGLLILGGVSDNNNKNLPKFKAMATNPKGYDCFCLFSGRQHYRNVFPDGFTPEDDIIQSEINKRQLKKNAGDLDAYVLYITQNPIQIEDCFYIQGENHLDIDRVNGHLKFVETEINKGEIILQRGWLRAKVVPGKIEIVFDPDPQGGWYITEHPDQNVRNRQNPTGDYVGGSDNVDARVTEEEAKDAIDGRGKRSLQSMVILKTATSEVTAMYLYRHSNPDSDYQQKLFGAIYYNLRNLPEKNKPKELEYFATKSEAIFMQNGYPPRYFERYLKKTPKRFGQFSSKATSWGLDTSRNKEQLYLDYYIPYVVDNLEKIKIPRLIEGISKWEYATADRSPDECMALLMAVVNLNDTLVVENIKTTLRGPTNSRIRLPRAKYGPDGKIFWG